MPGHVLDACFIEDLRTADLLATSCMNLEQPMVGGFAASAGTELASRIAELKRCRVRIRYLEPAEVGEQLALQVNHHALSFADAEALVIAQAEKAVLLTGDGSLRKAAHEAGIEVRGVIGELKGLVVRAIIDPPRALSALDSIVASGSRLPHDKVEAAKRQWSRMIDRGRDKD